MCSFECAWPISACFLSRQVDRNEIAAKMFLKWGVLVPTGMGRMGNGPQGGEAMHCVKVGKLNLVDLAGSERVHITGATGTPGCKSRGKRCIHRVG